MLGKGGSNIGLFDDRYPRPNLLSFRKLIQHPKAARKKYKQLINELKASLIHEPSVIAAPPWLFNNPYLLLAFDQDPDFADFLFGRAKNLLQITQRGERIDTAKGVFEGMREKHLAGGEYLSSWWEDIRGNDYGGFEKYVRPRLEAWSKALARLGQTIFLDRRTVEGTPSFGQKLKHRIQECRIYAYDYPWFNSKDHIEKLNDYVEHKLSTNGSIVMADIVQATNNGPFKSLSVTDKRDVLKFCRSTYVDWNAELSGCTRIRGNVLTARRRLSENIDVSSLFSDRLIAGNRDTIERCLIQFGPEKMGERIELLFTERILDQFDFCNDIPEVRHIGEEVGYFEAWKDAFGLSKKAVETNPEQIEAMARFIKKLREFMGAIFLHFRKKKDLGNLRVEGIVQTFLHTTAGQLIVLLGTQGPTPEWMLANSEVVYLLAYAVGPKIDLILSKLPFVQRIQRCYYGGKVIKSLVDLNRL